MRRYTIDTDDGQLFVSGAGVDPETCPHAAQRISHTVLYEMARDTMVTGGERTLAAVVRDEKGTEVYRATLTLRGEWMSDIPPR